MTSWHYGDKDSRGLHKDVILEQLAGEANVAQFVSFGPGTEFQQRFCHIHGYEPNQKFQTARDAVTALLKASPDGAVNVRSYRPEQPKGGEFTYGLTNVELVVEKLGVLASSGAYTIVNETVDVMDGGVSGVAVGNLIEFAPHDTPRCVERPGACSLPRRLGIAVLERVFGFPPDLDFPHEFRVEFSIHPLRRGVRHRHTIIWEIEQIGDVHTEPNISWPNRFSMFLGDKAFGLLIADFLGLPVPKTTAIGRQFAPFSFGQATGIAEQWIRTCPVVQEPGKFSTRRGWKDPFALLAGEDPIQPPRIASILAQEGVEAVYSGALIDTEHAGLVIEGVKGSGEKFMLGQRAPEILPEEVQDAVTYLFRQATTLLGSVRMEWVFDGKQAWIVQLHKGSVVSTPETVVYGQPIGFDEFDVTLGLDALRKAISTACQTGRGILLKGDVGVTSHFGDLLRKANIPSRLQRPTPTSTTSP